MRRVFIAAALAGLALAGCGSMPTGNPHDAAAPTITPVPVPTPQPESKGGWYIPINPPLGGEAFNIGPFPNCPDMAGSFMFSHPDACHRTGRPKDCGIIGNGQAYPAGVPWPLPKDYKPIAGGCFRSATETPMHGWHFLEYHSLPTPGGSAPACSEFAKYKALADADPAHYQVATVRKGCGGPCWPTHRDNACQ